MEKESIGFDLDSVICDFDGGIDEVLKTKFNLYLDWNKDFVFYNCLKNPHLSTRVVEYMEEAIFNGELCDMVVPYGDVHAGLELLKKEDFDIKIVTSRGTHNNEHMKSLTIDWLKKHNITYDDIFFAKAVDKKDIIFELGLKAFVEDVFDILTLILEKCGPLPYGLIIRDHPWNRKYYNENVDRVSTFKKACQLIKRYKKHGKREKNYLFYHGCHGWGY